MAGKPIDIHKRLVEKIIEGDAPSYAPHLGPCWLWIGAKNDRGYGQMRYCGVTTYAHRVSYMLFVGEILDGLDIDHLCRVRLCVNPEHLEPVTRRANLLRGNTITADFASRTHCLRGHPFDTNNTYITPTGHRRCKECVKIKQKEAYAKAKTRAETYGPVPLW